MLHFCAILEHFNFIYFGPKSGADKSIPLVVVIHGGPHSNYVNLFSLDYYLLVLSGKGAAFIHTRRNKYAGLHLTIMIFDLRLGSGTSELSRLNGNGLEKR